MAAPAMSLIALLAGQLVGLVFLAAGAGKLSNPWLARTAVEAYGLLPVPAARLVGVSLPWVELAVAASLVTGIQASHGAAIALALLLVFSVAEAIVLARGQEVPCGCFGSFSTRPVGWGNILSNIALAGCCVLSLTAYPLPYAQWLGHSLPLQPALLPTRIERLLLQLLAAGLLTQGLILEQVLDNRRQEMAYARHVREVSAAAAIQRLHQEPSADEEVSVR